MDIRKKVFAEVKVRHTVPSPLYGILTRIGAQKYSNLGSQIGDERPIAQVRFAPNNQILATGSWSGTVKLWNVPQCTEIKALRGHTDKVSGVAWHPQATLSQSPDAVNLVSGAGEGAVNLWSLNRSVVDTSQGLLILTLKQRPAALSYGRPHWTRLSRRLSPIRRICRQCRL